MKNTYIIIGIIVIVAILALVFMGGSSDNQAMEKEGDSMMEGENMMAMTLEQGTYEVVAEESYLTWKGEFVTGMSENGTVDVKSGSVNVGGDISGNFVIDMSTINDVNDNQRLENHLKNDDFFSVETYPEASFVITSFAPTENNAETSRYIIGGDLTVKGITKPISFPATITESEDGSLMVVSSFAINRADWEIKYNSASFFSDLGDKVIRDAIELGLNIKLSKENE